MLFHNVSSINAPILDVGGIQLGVWKGHSKLIIARVHPTVNIVVICLSFCLLRHQYYSEMKSMLSYTLDVIPFFVDIVILHRTKTQEKNVQQLNVSSYDIMYAIICGVSAYARTHKCMQCNENFYDAFFCVGQLSVKWTCKLNTELNTTEHAKSIKFYWVT